MPIPMQIPTPEPSRRAPLMPPPLQRKRRDQDDEPRRPYDVPLPVLNCVP